MFQNNTEKAIARAAYRQLEKALKEDGELPPGFSLDVSGMSVTITLAQGTTIKREEGELGDGTLFKKATSSLYGFSVWALMAVKLKKFKQWPYVEKAMLSAMRDVLKKQEKGVNVKDYISEKYPDVEDEILKMQGKLKIPKRKERIPAVCRAISPAHISIVKKKEKEHESRI